ncbi:MAG: M56 family metallopeptidase [Sphingosinicella sp.]
MDLNFLIDMAWKSALIAGAALGLTSALRSRAPADRVLVLRIGASLLLALPAAMLLLPSLDIAAFSAPEPAALGSPMASPIFDSAGATVAAPTAAPALWDDPTPLVLLLYLGGLAWAGSRLLAGLVMLHLWTRGAHRIACSEWQAAFEHTRWTAVDAERVRLLVSDEVASPLSWGWSRPTILIDRETLRHPEDADAILAHEMEHIARCDWPLLLLIRAAAALFWFNPLVWLLEREAVQQAEEAADLAAAERVEPLR